MTVSCLFPSSSFLPTFYSLPCILIVLHISLQREEREFAGAGGKGLLSFSAVCELLRSSSFEPVPGLGISMYLVLFKPCEVHVIIPTLHIKKLSHGEAE